MIDIIEHKLVLARWSKEKMTCHTGEESCIEKEGAPRVNQSCELGNCGYGDWTPWSGCTATCDEDLSASLNNHYDFNFYYFIFNIVVLLGFVFLFVFHEDTTFGLHT